MTTKDLIYLAAAVIAGLALVQLVKSRAAPTLTASNAAPGSSKTVADAAADYRQELFRSVPEDFYV